MRQNTGGFGTQTFDSWFRFIFMIGVFAIIIFVFAGPAPAQELPDLTVSALSHPASAAVGQTVTVSHTVTAAASGGNAGTFKVGIFLSKDAVITGSDKLLASYDVSGLAAGASSSKDTVVTIPLGYSGTNYIGAAVDISEWVAESEHPRRCSPAPPAHAPRFPRSVSCYRGR